jgi:phage repressor protein C with HTH and peptisase S24 domain
MGEVIEFRPQQAQLPAEDETVYLHPVRGDSMEPTARHGDVWIYRAADRYEGPGVYAVTDGCYPQFKRLEAVPGTQPGRVLIQSDNPLYGPQEVDLAGLQILGRVAGVIARR